MRGLFRYLYVGVILLVVACSTDEPINSVVPPEIQEHKRYTVMVYGCGDGEIDEYFEYAIDVVNLLDVPKYINIVGQMKWGNGYRSDWSDGSGCVTRMKYNHETKRYDNSKFDYGSLMMNEPKNLAEFIEWARAEAPADEYIIVFMGHGNAYHPSFEGGATRGILRDDDEIAYLGLTDIAEAFKTTQSHFGLMHMVSCLTNSIEYITELAPYVDYYLAPNHVTSPCGIEIYSIIDGLINIEQHDSTSVAKAAAYYIDQAFNDLWDYDYLTIDYTLTECRKINKLNNTVRAFTNAVVKLYDEEKIIGSDGMNSRYGFTTATIDEALSKAYYPVSAFFSENSINALEWYRLSYAFDIVDIVTKVAEATQLSDIAEAAENIKAAATDAIVHQRCANLTAVDGVYYSVMLINSEQWETLGLEDAGYENTAFNRVAKWSNLLKANNATFLHCR